MTKTTSIGRQSKPGLHGTQWAIGTLEHTPFEHTSEVHGCPSLHSVEKVHAAVPAAATWMASAERRSTGVDVTG